MLGALALLGTVLGSGAKAIGASERNKAAEKAAQLADAKARWASLGTIGGYKPVTAGPKESVLGSALQGAISGAGAGISAWGGIEDAMNASKLAKAKAAFYNRSSPNDLFKYIDIDKAMRTA